MLPVATAEGPANGDVMRSAIMPRKLKVFRTPIGFHDAYVAAPSRKAALAAWGAEANLFARGSAEEVSEPALTKEPLDRPGEVIRKLRGTVDEHFAALPEAEPRKGQSRTAPTARPAAPARQRKPKRDELEAAETALDSADEEHKRIMRSLAEREKAFALERRKIERDQSAAMQRLEAARDRASARYEAAMTKWRAMKH